MLFLEMQKSVGNRNYNFMMISKFVLVFLILLICSNFIVGMYLRDNLYKIIWFGGDVYHMGVAQDFRKHGTFKIPYLTQDLLGNSLSETIKNYPTTFVEEGGKGPIYYVFLGTFLNLLGTTPKDFYFHASVFSNITSSAFLVIFFFVIRNKFNEVTAIASTIVLSFLPFFAWVSVRVLPDTGVFLLLSITAFLFLEKKIKHYLFFGLFTGLAHLTHEFGVLLGVAYVIFLFINREFKGALLVFVSWTVTLSPWLIRNYYYFGDVGQGLYLPFSTYISKIFSNIFHSGSFTAVSALSNPSIVKSIQTFTPFQVFIESFYQELISEYYMGYLIIFLILFSGFAFLTIEKLRLKKFIFLIPVGISYYLVNLYVNNVYVQFAFLFVIPVFLVYFFYKKGKSVFINKIPRIYAFIIWFVFCCLVAFFFTALVFVREVPETRQIMFPIFLLIPISMIGFNNVLSHFLKKKIKTKSQLTNSLDPEPNRFTNSILNLKNEFYMPLIMFVIVLTPIIYQEMVGIQFENGYAFLVFAHDDYSLLESWIQSHIHEGTIVSDLPSRVFEITGLSAVPIPHLDWGPIQSEQYLEYYNASYLVFYNANMYQPDTDVTLKNGYYRLITHMPNWYFSYDEVYYDSNSHVFKLTNLINNADMSDPVHYLRKADLLQQIGKTDEANKIYAELKDFKPTSIQQIQGLCDTYAVNDKYIVNAIPYCRQAVFIDKTNLVALYNLILAYAKTNQEEEMNKTLSQFSVVADFNSETLNGWIEFLDEQTSSNSIHDVYDLNISLIENQYVDKIKPYDVVIKVIQNKLHEQTDPIKQKEYLQNMILVLEYRGKQFMNLEDYNDAEKTYLEILRLDQFNENAHAQYAIILEKRNQLRDAINQYEFLSKLEGNNTKTIEKINELRMEIAK